jgi:hypothetical protein
VASLALFSTIINRTRRIWLLHWESEVLSWLAGWSLGFHRSLRGEGWSMLKRVLVVTCLCVHYGI